VPWLPCYAVTVTAVRIGPTLAAQAPAAEGTVPPAGRLEVAKVAKSRAYWAQCELKEALGAEIWIVVRHRRGWFRVPATTQAADILRGVQEGWTHEAAKVRHDPGTVRLPLDEWMRLTGGAQTEEMMGADPEGDF